MEKEISMSHLRSTSVLRPSGLLLSLVFTLLAACSPGEAPAGAGGNGGGGGGGMGGNGGDLPACSLGTTTADIEKKLFQGTKCSTCHSKPTVFPTTMDTVSPGLADRVLDKMAETDAMKGKCSGRALAPKDDPASGLFYEKVSQKPACGDRMPQSMPALSADEISCVKRWLLMVAAQ